MNLIQCIWIIPQTGGYKYFEITAVICFSGWTDLPEID